MSKIIVSCAITGSIHTPSMSPYLPFRSADIVGQALAAAKAGASILHLHARDPENGRPSAKVEHWQQFLPLLRRDTNAILNMSTGGSALMTLNERLAAPSHFQPEMASLNMGSMNFALYPLAERVTDWKFDWERPFLEGSDDLIFKNTPRDIRKILNTLSASGSRFEFECYDVSHLYMLHHLAARGEVTGPFFIQFVLGVLGGMPATPDSLLTLKRTADDLFGTTYEFSVIGAGRAQMQLAAMSAGMGGHVRVGLEDNLYIEKGVLARSNAEQVEKVCRIVQELGRTVATPDETRALLGLTGEQETVRKDRISKL